MPPEARRVRRLQRLEKVRSIAKQAATLEAARAEGTLTQLEALATRTQALADDYRDRSTIRDGLALRQLAQFLTGLSGISATTKGDAAQARITADRKQQDLARAERRRAAVEDRAKAGQRAIASRSGDQPSGSRRAVGTGLE
ncbi:MAG: hypothetical protein ABL912_13605 [Novosphingobium sp.]